MEMNLAYTVLNPDHVTLHTSYRTNHIVAIQFSL